VHYLLGRQFNRRPNNNLLPPQQYGSARAYGNTAPGPQRWFNLPPQQSSLNNIKNTAGKHHVFLIGIWTSQYYFWTGDLFSG
jgi:hypothetical protein